MAMSRLDLWNNVIGEEGARALANALKGKCDAG
jgi:hypothetical protein